ncbi:MAPEG family protein [Croceicoccus sp. F390]|uniref:MAPEG family protein n=1 Tax=Croceicoccus esteveae TaxID=3075597 RepID=A0ABU2ZFB5_9SPHN|nr:MAPEG family protein [Croceicoccus sp. F390]MDT0575289.1 MAPEG family protein [Croceicoccus sp. F390]
MLLPAAVLLLWTIGVMAWMFIDRGRAFRAHDIDLARTAPGTRGSDLASVLPAGSDWPAHNYAHLMEQPTVFYPAVVMLSLISAAGFDIALAWIYVVLRIGHSVWQITVNTIAVRAGIFLAYSLVLAILVIRVLLALLT